VLIHADHTRLPSQQSGIAEQIYNHAEDHNNLTRGFHPVSTTERRQVNISIDNTDTTSEVRSESGRW